MKSVLVLILTLFSSILFAQKIANFVLIGPDGITEDVKKATSFIAVKEYPDGRLERLDYKMGGPMTKLRSYSDKDLKILDGQYCEYAPNGFLVLSGLYRDNKKEGTWNTYDDSGEHISSMKYVNDTLVETIDLNVKDSISYPDEKEAVFPGGDKAWVKYIIKSLKKKPSYSKPHSGGIVQVFFTVSAAGKISEAYLKKSVVYLLDEDSLETILASPQWIPAFQNGRNVRAYRVQPFVYQEQ